MDSIVSFSRGLIMSNVHYVLRNKTTTFSPTSKIYLKEAHNFFKQIVENLGELAQSRNTKDTTPVYNFVPNMKEIINIRTSTGTSFKEEELHKIQGFFQSVVEMLESLGKDPQKIYNRSNYQDMISFFDSATSIFQKNPMFSEKDDEVQKTVFV